ncbi:MAG TPA: 2-C-methyl-D-erythritol 4-phosphate cytidylyltransferase [Bryobacteraceae bacterium]
MKVSVILPAAGLGTRMARPSGLEKSGRKQFLLLDGSPVLIHTIRKFLHCPSVSEIIVALRADDIAWVQELIDNLKPAKPVRLTEGGDSRQESVEHALKILAPDTDLVAVHDAVRPFVEPELVENVIAEAGRTGAAIAGIVPVDTVKQVHKHTVRATLPREHLILTQTPQVFKVALLREAFERAAADQFVGTDESSLVERLEQVEVSIVLGSDRNIKITKPADLDLARLFLHEETALTSHGATD